MDLDVDGRMDMNRANSHELTQLPGIGIDMARKIVAFRDRHGGEIHEWDELLGIHGFPAERIDEIRARARLRPVLPG
jgi:DNA uptake protein ComE-like DNA-binding protein